MEIRPALPSEAPILAKLGARLFRDTYAGRVPEAEIASYVTTAFTPEAQAEDILCPGGGVLIAWEGTEPVAYAQLRPSPCPTPFPFPDPLEVARFYLDSPWHGSGLAGKLMGACRDWASTQGRGALWLQVWEENPRAIRFYAKQGFQGYGDTTFRVGTILYRDEVLGLGPLRPYTEF